MSESQQLSTVRGHIFACTKSTERECLEGVVFGANKIYADKVTRVRAGDKLFLLNVDSDRLYGTFEAMTDGGFNLVPEAWKGRYPYQVKVGKDDQE